jgi:flavin-dependent dehydrogenase
MRYDALIIGGGPAGSTAGILLARAGWSVGVIEKATFPRRKVCGEFISATNALLLDELGVGETFHDMAGPEVRRVGLFAEETVLSAAMPKVAAGSRGWGRALGRETLDLLLLDQAVREGARLWQPWSAIALQGGPDGYACTIAAKGAEQVLQAPVVIAAHGSWERNPLPTSSARPHRQSDLLAFKAHFADCDLPTDLMPLLAFPGGYGGMVHTDAGRVSLSCCIRRDVLDRCRKSSPTRHAADTVLAHILASCRGARESLVGARLEDRWLSAGPINPGIRPRYRDGVFSVGNAAGEAHPIVAEGISMAMQSSYLLCRHLTEHQVDAVAGRDHQRIGSAYAADWRRHFAVRIRAAAVFAHVAMRPAAGPIVLPLLRRFPGILTIGAQLSGKANLMARSRFPQSPIPTP